MGLRDELRKKFSTGKKRISSKHDTNVQENQATIKLPTLSSERTDSTYTEVQACP
ncbi:hypothetical protein GGI43DRAFT_313914 [Trichoderma evansii]